MPDNENAFSLLAAWRRRVITCLVHRCWSWVREAGSVTARRPGPLRFGSLGTGSRLAFPLGTVFGEQCIHLGDHCVIGERVTLTAGMLPGVELGTDPIVRIGSGTVIGRGSHLVAHQSVTVGENVFCGPYTYITDENHSYDDPDQPIGKQWPRTDPVTIGDGSWLGAGSVVLPGSRLGRNVVVAAGAVVRGVVPDHSVVAGVPARVVRGYVPGRGWQPPLRTPPPVPLPKGVTYQQLLAVGRVPASPSVD